MKILVVEDDRHLRDAVVDSLMMKGIDTLEAGNGDEAIKILRRQPVDVVLSDINMPVKDGLQLLADIRQQFPWLPVLLMTAYGDVSQAVQAMQQGAQDYLMKPFELQELHNLLAPYIQQTDNPLDQDQPIAESLLSQRLFSMAERVASTDSTVLISGESGTGKEVLARFIHQNSDRRSQPFIAINCAAIPENMLEAMLFGYEKGAFTGAYNAMPGKFEQAHGGTLLLDEVTEMDIGLQAKLLRVLQERQVERLGGKRTIDLNVRVIATTNRQLAEFVAEGKFREDLYYRLSVFPLHWAPLRHRVDDILPLSQRLISHHAQKMKRPVPNITADVQQVLLNHPWPGNVRELDNTLQRALILQSGHQITLDDIILTPVPQLMNGEQSMLAPQDRQQAVNAAVNESAAEMVKETANETVNEANSQGNHYPASAAINANFSSNIGVTNQGVASQGLANQGLANQSDVNNRVAHNGLANHGLANNGFTNNTPLNHATSDPYQYGLNGTDHGLARSVETGAENNAVSGKGLGNDLKTREVELIVKALREEPSKKGAADRLGISPRTLRYKIARLRDEGVDIAARVNMVSVS